ncbi:hypothetical protein PIB30_089769 [Stylosanthes scabra]|uniref:Transposase n=1 Tax=Stylosanthes scabra TaxID=79078 RepID=A0ABU6YT11_9FABA|nr:hypothetical protein [Stylosanthes scabra]
MRAAKRLRKIMHGIRNKEAPHGWIREDLWARLVEFWQQEDFKKLKQAVELGRTPTQSEVFARTHTRKEDREWVDKRKSGAPPIDEAEVWARVAGGRKRGRIYGMCVIPSHKYPPLFSDPDDDDTASGPPDLREQVTLLNREISQQAEAHAQSLAAVEAACAEKVRTLESTVRTQSQEVSDLRRAYSDMYSFLTQMRSGASGSGSMPDMPPPTPPAPSQTLALSQTPAPSQTPSSQPDQTTGSPHHDDDTDYI